MRYRPPNGLTEHPTRADIKTVQDDAGAAIQQLLRGADVLWDPQARSTTPLRDAMHLVAALDAARDSLRRQREVEINQRCGPYQLLACCGGKGILSVLLFHDADDWQQQPAGFLDVLGARLNTAKCLTTALDPDQQRRPVAVYQTYI